MDRRSRKSPRGDPTDQMEDQEDIFVEHHESATIVKGGSLRALVEHLTRHDRLDAAFNRTFLTTYESFTTAHQLHELLTRRFNVSPPTGLNPTQVIEWSNGTKAVIQLRVINVLRQWLELFWLEAGTSETEKVLREMQSFVRAAIPVVERAWPSSYWLSSGDCFEAIPHGRQPGHAFEILPGPSSLAILTK